MKKTYKSGYSENIFDRRLALLYFLNLSDYLFTLVLISSGLFIEANPLLSFSINGAGGFLAKCILPLLLLYYIRSRLITNPTKHILAAKIILDIAVSLYFAINCFHIFWLCYTIVVFL